MIVFKILWIADAIAVMVIFYFFIIGLADGTVNIRNAGAWLIVVLAIAGIMGGSIWFKTHGHMLPAFLLLLVLALPALFFALYMLIVICSGTNFR